VKFGLKSINSELYIKHRLYCCFMLQFGFSLDRNWSLHMLHRVRTVCERPKIPDFTRVSSQQEWLK